MNSTMPSEILKPAVTSSEKFTCPKNEIKYYSFADYRGMRFVVSAANVQKTEEQWGTSPSLKRTGKKVLILPSAILKYVRWEILELQFKVNILLETIFFKPNDIPVQSNMNIFIEVTGYILRHLKSVYKLTRSIYDVEEIGFSLGIWKYHCDRRTFYTDSSLEKNIEKNCLNKFQKAARY